MCNSRPSNPCFRAACAFKTRSRTGVTCVTLAFLFPHTHPGARFPRAVRDTLAALRAAVRPCGRCATGPRALAQIMPQAAPRAYQRRGEGIS